MFGRVQNAPLNKNLQMLLQRNQIIIIVFLQTMRLYKLIRDHTFMMLTQTGDGVRGLQICHVFADFIVFEQ